MYSKTSRLKAIFAALVAVIALAFSASPALAGTMHTATPYAAQARRAGLTTPQAAALQKKVDGYLTHLGGKQVAPNVIDLGGKGSVFVALPGEAHPRDLANGALYDPCAGGGADPYYFCAYSGIDWTGTSIAMYTCKSYTIPYAGNGSWDNNQSTGTKARMYNPSGTLIYTTLGARSYDDVGNWTPVHTVRNC